METGKAPSDKQELAKFWNQNRRYYELAAAANVELSTERQRMVAWLHGGELVLDIGSGSCENALWLPPGCRYIGLDVSLVALLMAREAGRPAWGVRADSERLPFATASLDAAISTYALEHFHDPGRTLREIARSVRPGGLVMILGSTWDLPYEFPPSLNPGRRLEVSARRLTRQIRTALLGRHRFDTVASPRVLRDGYIPDSDAVHVAQSYQIARYLRALGLDILEHTTFPHRAAPHGPRRILRKMLSLVPLWRHAWGNNLLVARRGEALQEPAYTLCPL